MFDNGATGNAIGQPVLPAPPHDPYWWHLDSRTGWRTGLSEQLDGLSENLELQPLPSSEAPVIGPVYGISGAILPPHMAWSPEAGFYLLECDGQRVARFDGCDCEFKRLPGLGGHGSGPRQFDGARAIGVQCGNLFVCDTGNARVSVFALHGLVLRAHWTPPRDAGLDHPWRPVAIAFDDHEVVHVADAANGMIHRFNRFGIWLTPLTGFDGIRALGFDAAGRLLVVCATPSPRLYRVDPETDNRETIERRRALNGTLPDEPFELDRDDNIDLSTLCSESTAAVFDAVGDRIDSFEVSEPRYPDAGTYRSEPLDSEIGDCQWHRVVVAGDLPRGTRVRIQTFTAETRLPTGHIDRLGDGAWSEGPEFQGQDRAFEGLIRSDPGRYLWLRLTLVSDGNETPSLSAVRVEFPRVSLSRYLPAVYAEDPDGSAFTDRFLALFDTTFRSIEERVDHQARLFDPDATPAHFLQWLGQWVGLDMDDRLPEATRRRLLKQAARLYHVRGTRYSLHQQLLTYLGLDPEEHPCGQSVVRSRCRPGGHTCEPEPTRGWKAPPLILEHYQLRRWLYLGRGRLGDQSVLWGERIVNRSRLDGNAQADRSRLKTSQDPLRDPFHVYAHRFSVFVPASRCRDRVRRGALKKLIETEKPAHTAYQLIAVEPAFRIGVQSAIGLDAVVGRYPEGVFIPTRTLGRDTILSRAPEDREPPHFGVGRESRVGRTTRLE